MEMLLHAFNSVLDHDFNKLGKNRLKVGLHFSTCNFDYKRRSNKKGRVAL